MGPGASKQDHERVVRNYVRLIREDKSNELLDFLDVSPEDLRNLEKAFRKGEGGCSFHYSFCGEDFAKKEGLKRPNDLEDYGILFSIYGYLLNDQWNRVLENTYSVLCDDLLYQLYELDPTHPYIKPAVFDREGNLDYFDEYLLGELTEITSPELIKSEMMGVDSVNVLLNSYVDILEQKVLEIKEKKGLVSVLKQGLK